MAGSVGATGTVSINAADYKVKNGMNRQIRIKIDNGQYYTGSWYNGIVEITGISGQKASTMFL